MTLIFLYVSYIPVYPGRGLGHDGDLDEVDAAPAGLVRRTLNSREPWARPVDTTVHCALSGKTTPAANIRHRAIWGSVRASPMAKTAAKAWTRDFASTAGRHDRHYCESFASTQPFASRSTLRKRHYRFHPRRSCAQRSLTSESPYFSPSPAKPVLGPDPRKPVIQSGWSGQARPWRV